MALPTMLGESSNGVSARYYLKIVIESFMNNEVRLTSSINKPLMPPPLFAFSSITDQ